MDSSTRRRGIGEVLRDRSGISMSMTDAMGSVSIKMISILMGAALVAGAALTWTAVSASSAAASGFQVAGLGFEKSVAKAEAVTGFGTDAVSLFGTKDGSCHVETWQTSGSGAERSLHVDRAVVEGECYDYSQRIPAGTGTSSQTLLNGVEPLALSYSNIAGRTVTFNGAGMPTIAPGEAKPAAALSTDWGDYRAHKVTMKLVSNQADVLSSQRKATLVGTANISSYTAAVSPGSIVPEENGADHWVTITDVKRSATTGRAFPLTWSSSLPSSPATAPADNREGVSVSFSSGRCTGKNTQVTLSFERQQPTAATAVSTTRTFPSLGTTEVMDLANVQNGAAGALSVTASCDGLQPTTTTQPYTQPVPQPVVTVVPVGDTDRTVRYSWVTSLPFVAQLGSRYSGTVYSPLGTSTTSFHTYTHFTGTTPRWRTTSYSVVIMVGSQNSAAGIASLADREPLKVTSVARSTTAGDEYRTTHTGLTTDTLVNGREGVRVTFTGGECVTKSTRVAVRYARTLPSAQAEVELGYMTITFTNETYTIDVGNVPNGTSGNISLALTCQGPNGQMTERTDFGTYVQPVPAPAPFRVAKGTSNDYHVLRWTNAGDVVTYEIRSGTTLLATLRPTNGNNVVTWTRKSATTNGFVGKTTAYTVTAVINGVKSPVASASIKM